MRKRRAYPDQIVTRESSFGWAFPSPLMRELQHSEQDSSRGPVSGENGFCASLQAQKWELLPQKLPHRVNQSKRHSTENTSDWEGR